MDGSELTVSAALVLAIGVLWRHVLNLQKTAKTETDSAKAELTQRLNTQEALLLECEKQHSEARVRLARLEGLIEARDIIREEVKKLKDV